MFPEEDTALLKAWIVKRLENTSDADADVLADYVLALLRHDGDEAAVRKLCEEEIPDFLKEDSSVFVGDVFDAIKYKLYLPGARPPPKKPSPPPASLAGAWNKQLRPGTDFRHGGEPPERGFTNSDNYQSGARKRSYNERLDLDQGEGAGWDGSGGIGRVIKQPRRGGGFGQRGGGAVGGGRGVGGAVGDLNASRIPPLGHQTGVGPALFAGGAGGGGPPHPPPPLNLPPSAVDGGSSLDAKKALEAMITLHSMGMQMPHLMQFMGKPPPMPVQQGAAGRSPAQGKKKGRCRDFDNKGFCARGNTCPWDHGTDAIYAPPPPPPPQLPSRAEEYDPSNARLLGVDMMKTATAPSPFDATTTSSPRQRGNQRDKPSKKWRPRAEFSAEGPNHDRSKTTVVVENIPEEHFTEDEVRRFFSQFGPIVEVRMQPYKRLAIVKFETWDAANAAYKSPKVIFDNRFVKVFWFKDVDSLPTPPSSKGKRAAGAFNGAEGAVAGSPPEGVDMDEVLRKQQEAQRQFEEKTQRRQELERQRLEVEKRQRELEEKQQAEKAKLMAKLAAAGKGGAGVKDESSGDKDADAPRATAAAPSSGNPHTDALRAQLAALEEEAKSLGIDPDAPMDDAQPAGSSSYWGGYRGRGGRGRGFPYRGGRGAYIPRGGYRGGFRGGRGGGVAPAIHEAYAAYSLDNRPKKVSIVGVDFTDPKKDELLRQHLLGIGEFTDIQTSPESTQITFKDRKTAEKFMATFSAKDVGAEEGTVETSWVKNTATTPAPLTPSLSGTATPMDGLSGSASGVQAQPATHAAGNGKLAANATDSAQGKGSGGGQGDAEMDYDVGDENDWGN